MASSSNIPQQLTHPASPWQRWIQEAEEIDFGWLLRPRPQGTKIPNAEVTVVHQASDVAHGPLASQWQQWCAHFDLERASFEKHELRDKRCYGQLS